MFDIILNRGNDLTEFFWPLLYYIKNQILTGNGIPLWITMFFSGTSLMPDPQNLFIYPLNIIFLFYNYLFFRKFYKFQVFISLDIVIKLIIL